MRKLAASLAAAIALVAACAGLIEPSGLAAPIAPAVDIQAEFRADEVAPAERFAGVLVRLEGTVQETGTDTAGVSYITLVSGSPRGIKCEFPPERSAQAGLVSAGQTVAMLSIYASIVTGVAFDHCDLVSASEPPPTPTGTPTPLPAETPSPSPTATPEAKVGTPTPATNPPYPLR
jgi:hypothetical protein